MGAGTPARHDDVVLDVALFIMSGLYAGLFVIGLGFWFRYFPRSQLRYNIFIVAFVLGSVIRAVYFGMIPFLSSIKISQSVAFFLGNVPSFFFFTMYTVQLLQWRDLYERSFQAGGDLVPFTSAGSYTERFTVLVAIINVVMYTVVGTLFIVDISATKAHGDNVRDKEDAFSTTYQRVIVIMASIMYWTITFAFFVYLYQTFKSMPRYYLTEARMFREQLRIVGILGLFCCICFIVRGFITVLQFFITEIGTNLWVAVVYYLLLELVPIVMMLLVLRQITKSNKARADSNIAPSERSKLTGPNQSVNFAVNPTSPLILK